MRPRYYSSNHLKAALLFNNSWHSRHFPGLSHFSRSLFQTAFLPWKSLPLHYPHNTERLLSWEITFLFSPNAGLFPELIPGARRRESSSLVLIGREKSSWAWQITARPRQSSEDIFKWPPCAEAMHWIFCSWEVTPLNYQCITSGVRSIFTFRQYCWCCLKPDK